MASLGELFVVAIVQAITEWLPVSSSGHLVLLGKIMSVDVGLRESVAVHFGTLLSVVVYFWGDIGEIFRDVFGGDFKKKHGKLGLLLMIATIPAVIVGYGMRGIFNSVSGNLLIVSLGFGITGLFLLIASKDWKVEKSFGWGKAGLIGIAQALAIVPGISRSGATIGSGLLLGLDEREAMKFSFLMAVPVILGANLLGIGFLGWNLKLVFAAFVSFVFGLGTIHILYDVVLRDRKNLKWFGIYALVLGLLVFILALL